MNRRDTLIALVTLGAATRTAPLSAQSLDKIRRIGVLMGYSEEAIAALGRQRSAGLVVMVDSFMVVHRKAAIDAAARHKVPAVYFSSFNVRDGALISYGVDVVDLFRRAAPNVDQLLRGANVAELPFQMPVMFEPAVNRKTANALGITIPQSLLVRANEVIE